MISFELMHPYSAAASGWAGWALAHSEFGSSVNPITTRGADYAHHITASPPGFENPAASLRLGDSDVRILLGIQGRLHKTFLVHFLILKTREINSECNFDLSNWVTQLWIFALLSFCFYC